MKMRLLLLTCLLTAALQRTTAQNLTIAFGSCSRQDLADKQLWKEVLETKPDYWVWTGDNIYGDTRDMNAMRAMYEKQKSHPDYQRLIQSVKVLGTWDDHDYGVNDGGKDFPEKDASKEEMLRFLDVPADAAVRNHSGVYQSYDLKAGTRTVRLILLDTRYFRDELKPSRQPGVRYEINPNGDILGEAQWSWLEGELTRKGADITMVVSSIQVIPEEQGFEKWANFPSARERLLKLIEKSRPRALFMVSGDRHIAETSRIDLPGFGYPLFEFTSSGLTHTWTRSGEEPNKYRTGPFIIERNFGLLNLSWEKGQPEFMFKVIGPAGKVLSESVIQFPSH
mgnify:FL=1